MGAPANLEPRGLPYRVEEAASRLVARPAFWVLLLAAVVSWPVTRAVRAALPPPLPVLAELPRFELTDEGGRPFGSRDLQGKVWVASFIFTRCPTICPRITARMAEVQRRTQQLAPALHLVSFSVDPGYDTPERLRDYARAHHASPRLWSFLTGPEEAVRRAVVDGLKVSMGRERDDGSAEAIFHGSHLVLVDARARVRGYYDPEEPGALDRLVRDAGLLVNRGG
ncbi:MAG TPA: SCO family protein [Anaeromyxobacteraceae bacterium]|nr:SCO family protein [Anaeromyxobacteraceae bacterium]